MSADDRLDICGRCHGIIGEVPWPKAGCSCPPGKGEVGHTVAVADLPREYVERLRVNMGLLAENTVLKKREGR